MSLSTAAIADACMRCGIEPRPAPLEIRPLAPGMLVAGRVLPVFHRGSVDAFFEAMTRAREGDILVIDNQGRHDEGCIGDLTAIEAMHYDLAGMVVWGRHRDTSELLRLGLPIFSIGSCSLGPSRLDPATAALEIAIIVGSLAVSADDWVFGDDDGVLFVPKKHVEEVMKVAAEIIRAEQSQAERVRHGFTLHQQFRWEEYVRRRAANADYDFRTHLRTVNKAIEV